MAIEIRIFPAKDDVFRRAVDSAINEMKDVDDRDANAFRAVVERHLRRHYRNVQIHERDGLGTLLESNVVWYVYRDGRVRNDDERRDRLYEALSRARSAIADSERAMERSASADEKARRPWARRKLTQ